MASPVQNLSVQEFAHLKDNLCPARLSRFSLNKIRQLRDTIIWNASDGLLHSKNWVCICRVSPRKSMKVQMSRNHGSQGFIDMVCK